MSREDKIFEYLYLQDAVEISGVDEETGEFLFTFTPKLKEVMPELYNIHMQNVTDEIMKFWEKGFVDVDLLSDDPIVNISDKAFDEEALKSLSKDDLRAMKEIKRVLGSSEL